jgi:hypothetical protein
MFFIAALCCLAITSGIFETSFNNFLVDTFQLSPAARGQLEFPRELPGFLVAVFAGILFFLTEIRFAALTAFIVALGLAGFYLGGNHFPTMLVAMMIWSSGVHLFMPLESSIGLALAEGKNPGRLLGKLGGYSTFAVIGGCGLVWLGREYWHFSYALLFACGALAALVAGILFLRMPPIKAAPRRRNKFIFRRQYSLYYWLCLLFGARKQIFITFGPLVLIRVFHQPAETIAKLWIIASVLGILFKPALGWMIDRLGERFVLMTDAVVLVGIGLGYGFGQHFLPSPIALYLVCGCYVLDMMFFAMEIARSTYLDKIALSREEVGPTLGLGVSINHAVSMTIPTLGGLVWGAFGYHWVFVGSAAVAVITFFSAARIRLAPTQLTPAALEKAVLEEKIEQL